MKTINFENPEEEQAFEIFKNSIEINRQTETINGAYGSYGFRCYQDYRFWKCQWSSDYAYNAVVDDFGILVPVGEIKNIRGY